LDITRRARAGEPEEKLEQLAREIMDLTEEIMRFCDQAVDCAVDAERLLIEAKKLVPDGQWHKRLKANVCKRTGVTLRSAQRWMQLAREAKEDMDEYMENYLEYSHEISDAIMCEPGDPDEYEPDEEDIASPPN
jgi:Protein of unknown function (DUF3102)